MNLTERAALQWMVAAAAVGLVLRVGFGMVYWVNKPLTHDEREYLALATSLSERRGFVYDTSHDSGTGQHFGRAPGYPAFLAIIGAGTDGHSAAPPRVKLTQAFMGSATVLLIGLIARHAAGASAGLAAAAITAVYPPLVWISSYVFSESLYAPVALLAAHTLQRGHDASTDDPGGRRAIGLTLASGALGGSAVLIRPAMLFFILLAVIWLLGRGRLRLAVIFAITVTVVLAPWTVRNVHVHGRFILVASEGGVTFWTGNHPLARGEGDLAANPDLKRAELEFRQAHRGLTADQLEPLYYREAFRWIASNPADWLWLLARKAFFTVVPIGPSYALHSTRYRVASVVSYATVLPFAIAGIPRLWRSPRRPSAVLLLGASAVVAGLVFFPQERFRIPVIDPVLIISAASALSVTIARTRHASGAAS